MDKDRMHARKEWVSETVWSVTLALAAAVAAYLLISTAGKVDVALKSIQRNQKMLEHMLGHPLDHPVGRPEEGK
jgi:hypothetical protein